MFAGTGIIFINDIRRKAKYVERGWSGKVIGEAQLACLRANTDFTCSFIKIYTMDVVDFLMALLSCCTIYCYASSTIQAMNSSKTPIFTAPPPVILMNSS